jgi:hypothetical protein
MMDKIDAMVDRVADAIARAESHKSDTMYADMARAAIEAMREPTDEMIEAAVNRDNPSDSDILHYVPCSHEEAWGAMIDAALRS